MSWAWVLWTPAVLTLGACIFSAHNGQIQPKLSRPPFQSMLNVHGEASTSSGPSSAQSWTLCFPLRENPDCSCKCSMPPHPRVSEPARCSQHTRLSSGKVNQGNHEQENPVLADRKLLAVCPCHPGRAQLSGLCSHSTTAFDGTRHQTARVPCSDNSSTILHLWAYFFLLVMARSSPNCPDPIFKAC